MNIIHNYLIQNYININILLGLQVEVIGFKQSEINKNITFYIIEVQKRGFEKWIVEKRYSEFDGLLKFSQ